MVKPAPLSISVIVNSKWNIPSESSTPAASLSRRLALPSCGRLLHGGLGHPDRRAGCTSECGCISAAARRPLFGMRTTARRRGGDPRRPAERRVRVLRSGSRRPVRSPSRARSRIAALGVPAVSTRRPQRPARNVRLPLALLPDCGGSSQSPRHAASRSSRRQGRCARRRVEGLDARDALPPLLRPGMLTERRLRRLGTTGDRDACRDDLTAEQALASSGQPHARRAIVAAGPRPACATRSTASSTLRPRGNRTKIWTRRDPAHRRSARLALSSVPRGSSSHPARRTSRAGWQPAARHGGDEFDRHGSRVPRGAPVRKLGRVLRSGPHAVVEYLRVALAVSEDGSRATDHARGSPSSPWQTVNEAVRNADLLLVHLADPKALAQPAGPAPP